MYLDKGEEIATEYLTNELNGYDYKYIINDTNEKYVYFGEEIVERYSTFSLNVKGNEYSYQTYGDKDYSDDQTFYKNKS